MSQTFLFFLNSFGFIRASLRHAQCKILRKRRQGTSGYLRKAWRNVERNTAPLKAELERRAEA